MNAVIIGAGVAGLSAGCYLRMNGFDTDIYEMNSTSGGLCTGWKREGFTFNTSLHWLMGTNPCSPFYQLWTELIDMSSLDFYYPETRLDIETLDHRDRHGNNIFHLYTDLNGLKDYLLDLAPEDEKEIRKFIAQIRKIQSYDLPPEIRKLPDLLPWYKKIGYARYLPMLFFLRKYSKISSRTLSEKFKNPFLKEAFQLLFDGEDRPIMIHTVPLACFDQKSAGYPMGGAVAFAKYLEGRYLSLGGKLHFNSKVDKILVDRSKAVGISLEEGPEIKAGLVISAADWKYTVFHALGGHYKDKNTAALGEGRKLEVFHSVFMIFLGLNKQFGDLTGLHRFPLEAPLISPDGTGYNRLELHLHNYDPTLAPAGKTVASVCLYTRRGEFWIRLRESDPAAYRQSTEDFTNKVIDILDKKFGSIKEKVEAVSTATPATYHRYTNNWMGSIQGWLPGKEMISPSPVKYVLPGLKDFYFAGHWTMPGGGLPTAIKSARYVAMIICHNAGKKFLTSSHSEEIR